MVFVIDVLSRRMMGWRQSSSMHTDFVLDTLEQTLYDRKPLEEDGLITIQKRARKADSTGRRTRNTNMHLLVQPQWFDGSVSNVPPADFEGNNHQKCAGQAATV